MTVLPGTGMGRRSARRSNASATSFSKTTEPARRTDFRLETLPGSASAASMLQSERLGHLELQPARVLGIDGTEAALEVAASRGLPVSYADFRKPLALPFRPNLITALDVLEHIDDDALALRSLAKAASDDAILMLTVPALPSLFSRWDEVSGHRRRYLRRPLGACLEANGWFPLRIRYFFSYCVPPAWIERRLLGRVQEFEFPRIRPALNMLLTRLGELECRLGDPVPFGTSLIAVARRNRATA